VEVLQLVADGCANADIARRLHLSDKTIRSSIFAKLQVEDRAQAILRAHRAGLPEWYSRVAPSKASRMWAPVSR
jgi:DNA-binding NarL/FixJ family response regulator